MKEFVEKIIGRLEEQESDLTTWAEDKAFEIGIQTAILIVSQLAEEYNDEELRNSQEIYNFIKREINPYGKPFEGTVYEFGLKVMKYIRNLSTEEYNNGWIPCSERLPEIGKWVLGQGVYDMMLVCYTKSYRGDFDWMDINGDLRVISAWQPLPAPYQKGE